MRKIGSTLPIGLRLLLGFLLVGVPGTIREARATCRSNTEAHLVQGCADGWDDVQRNGENFNPWPATPLADGDTPDPIDLSHRVELRADMCQAHMRVLNVEEKSHMASVVCGAVTSHPVWLNLDHLDCEDNNVLRQPMSFSPAAMSCPPPTEVPGASVESTVGPVGHRALSDLQQARLDRIHGIMRDIDQRSREDSFNLLQPYWALAETSASSPSNRAARLRDLHAMIHRSVTTLQAIKDRLTRAQPLGYGPKCDQPTKTEDVNKVHGQSTCEMTGLGLELARELDGKSDEDLAEAIEAYQHGIEMNDKYLRLRIALFYGLSTQQQDQMVVSRQVQLARVASEIPPVNGQRVYDLHDGYVYGGHRNPSNGSWAYDCSDFTASVVGARAGAPTTYELRNIALSLNHQLPAGQSLSASERRYASCFNVVDLRQSGQEPQPLDLVVSRNDDVAHGHVVLVNDFNPATGEIDDFEAHGAPDRRLGKFRRPLFEQVSCMPPSNTDSPIALRSPPRADLFILRLKPSNADAPGCPLNLDSAS